MIAEGALDGVAGVSGIHVFPTLPSGTIASKVRPSGKLCLERKRLHLTTMRSECKLWIMLARLLLGMNCWSAGQRAAQPEEFLRCSRAQNACQKQLCRRCCIIAGERHEDQPTQAQIHAISAASINPSC